MNAHDLFEHVTADLITAIEAGATDWQMPWQRLAITGLPRSVDGRPYRGFNTLVLALTAGERGFTSNTWATYKAWGRDGAQVRRGEHGTHVVLWKQTERHTTQADPTSDEGLHRSLFARTFTVFAAEQVDGAEHVIQPAPATDPTPALGEAETFFAAIGARTVTGGNLAYYSPRTDTIHIPPREQFHTPSEFYSTLAHEATHWTAAGCRLNRDLTGRFGDHAYGAEELIAELGAAFWCAQFGLDQATRTDHARYLGDWLALLATDTRALVAACGKAQQAIDYLNTLAGWTPPTITVPADAVAA